MASVRKRKMARSLVKKNTKRVKDKQRNIKMSAHPVMREHWDNKLTLKQNYKRLGLTHRLGKPAGGGEARIESLTEYRKAKEEEEARQKVEPSAIENETDPAKIPEGEARLIRDPDTKEVVEIIYGTMKTTSFDGDAPERSIIDDLQKYNDEHAGKKKAKKLTEREHEWIGMLHAKYGEDYEKMRWDQRLNPTFVTTGQLKKKMALWKSTVN